MTISPVKTSTVKTSTATTSTAFREIRQSYLEVNGDHPMTADDDSYCRARFVPLDAAGLPAEEVHRLVLDRCLPLPSYLLSDGTPMVHPGYLDLLGAAGGAQQVEAWFRGHWPAEEQETAAEEWEAYLSGQYVCLHEVTPVTIQAKTRLIEAIKAAVGRLDSDPADDGAREALQRAVDELDRLEPPFAPHYDRLRFGGPSSREVWIEQVRATYLLSAGS